MAGLGAEVGDDLRDLRHPPAHQAYQPEPKRDLVLEIAQAVLEVLLDPTNARLPLPCTVRDRHLPLLLYLYPFYPQIE